MIDILEHTTYDEAIQELSDCLHGDIFRTIPKDSKLRTRLQTMLTQSIFHGLLFPDWLEYQSEDEEMLKKIKSFSWVTPNHLDINLCATESMLKISMAADQLVCMSVKENPFEKLSCLVDCCFHANAATSGKNGADELLPTMIYVILQGKAAKLYSNVMYLQSFMEINEKVIQSQRFSQAIPVMFGGLMDNCFTQVLCALTAINNMEGDEGDGLITFGNGHLRMQAKNVNQTKAIFQIELIRNFDELERSINNLIRSRAAIINQHKDSMLQIADKLDTHRTNVNISKATGTFASIAGGVISIVGFGLMFATFGAAVVMIPVGASLAFAGGATAGGASLAEFGINKSTANDIKQIRDKYEVAVNETFKTLKKIEETANNIWRQLTFQTHAGKSILSLVDVVMKLARLSVAFENVSDIGVTAYRAASTAGRGLAIAGVVFSAVLLPIDMIFFGIHVRNLSIKEKSAQGVEIRKWIEQDLPNVKEVNDIVVQLRNALQEFIESLRTNDNSKEKDAVTESEKKFKDALKLVEDLITQDDVT